MCFLSRLLGWFLRILPWLLCIQHIPFIAEHPTKRRKLAVNHSPFEIVPWPQVFDPVFPLDLLGRFESAFPDIALNGAGCVIFYWKRFLFDDLGPALFNGNAAVPVPVVPDLIYKLIDVLQNLGQPAWLLNPFQLELKLFEQIGRD